VNPYPEYKNSGLSWLGKVPKHWEIEKLKFNARVRFSNVNKKTEEGEIPVKLCNYVDVYYNSVIGPDIEFMEASASLEEIKKFQLRAGDVLITKDSEEWTDIAVPAHVVIDIQNLLCGYHLAQIRSENRLRGDFLFWLLSSNQINYQFKIEASGVTRYGLSNHALSNSIVLLPPVEEQKRLTDFLKTKTAQIDDIISKKEKMVELLKEERAAIINQAVTKGLDPKVELKDSGIPWLSKIPKHWEKVPLKWNLQIVSGDSLAIESVLSEPVGQNDIPVIGGNGVMGYTNTSNITSPTVVVGRVGALCGNVHYIEPAAWITDNALRVKNVTKYSLKYLVLLLATMDLNKLANQNAQPLITGTLVKKQVAPLPPLEEQTQIISYVSQQTGQIDAQILREKKSIDLLRDYRAALISEVVTGKIDVRGI